MEKLLCADDNDVKLRTLYFRYEIEDKVEAELNEFLGMAEICGYEYPHGTALRQVDDFIFQEQVQNTIERDYEEIDTDNMLDEERAHYRPRHNQAMYQEA